ncbi:hypothetical protein [Clostridium sp.]|uniref:hypothetical protein n=1 Tax=Clostridium sp. TaxID=1506 RepID=UPI00283F3C8A|nr:hypothetical protein [Clostridium sp.]MDR3594414.1 hypothetical protein [Clostridium sp.]
MSFQIFINKLEVMELTTSSNLLGLNAAQLGETQAASTEEISVSMQQFTATAAELEKIAGVI